MRIAIDARAYSWTGIGRYIRHLIAELIQLPTDHQFVVLLSREDEAAFRRDNPLHPRLALHHVQSSYYSWREQTLFWAELLRVSADLFHFTHFNVPLLFAKPYVVTIHDTTRFIFSGQKSASLFQQAAYEIVFGHAVRQARAVMCVSRSTADELSRLPVSISTPPTVIYEGVDSSFSLPAPDSAIADLRRLLKTDQPYFLFVGVWMNHKNIERLLHAFRSVRNTHPDMKLVITGAPHKGYVDVPALARRLGIEESVCLPGFVPAELLPALYQEAAALVFPSLYEGFGLPALEAALSHTPVVASNTTSLPEIMSTGALYVNPEDVESIARGMREILENSSLREQCVTDGFARARQFRWEKTAQQTLRVYDTVTASDK